MVQEFNGFGKPKGDSNSKMLWNHRFAVEIKLFRPP
jgi:hypothetical protein